ncbi:DUF1508 domain-containing protein [Gemmata sp. JC717]|uniref:DUF1508 domain-containing protein n=1 Tax=Gemmata algarum TaxID=2975278 RepID=UPI0021BAE4F5|nr:DUF1508 domain-containing protein [Gemmata algarum]MDY3551433.1 DUF1508 domain-containing protein [Gemmata algarum]
MKFEISQVGGDAWEFAAIASNGKVIVTSGTYARKRDALRGLESFCQKIVEGSYDIVEAA